MGEKQLPWKSTFRIKASPGRGKLSPQVTDEGAGQQHFALNTPHPALRATCSPFCRYATFSPGAGEICPQGVKALAPGQASKIDFREHLLPVQSPPPQKNRTPEQQGAFQPCGPGVRLMSFCSAEALFCFTAISRPDRRCARARWSAARHRCPP